MCGYNDRLNKGLIQCDRTLPRSLHGSIYNENFDPKQRDHLLTLPNQIDSVDPQKVMSSFSERVNFDKKSMKFTYNRRHSEFEKEYDEDR